MENNENKNLNENKEENKNQSHNPNIISQKQQISFKKPNERFKTKVNNILLIFLKIGCYKHKRPSF